jgi:hypothetical protein
MGFLGQTLVLYAVVGAGVAVAVYSVAGDPRQRWFRVVSAVPFWPMYIPILLAPVRPPIDSQCHDHAEPKDEMSVTIAQVDGELEGALSSLDGWAEDVLAREKGRIHELRGAWTAQAERIREMDRLLTLPECADEPRTGAVALAVPPDVSASSAVSDRLRQSWLARRQNVERLRRVRQRAYEDLMATLVWVRELVSMIHLAKFTGAPASRAEELVAQIAAAVEGLSQLTWQDEPNVTAADNT